MESAGYNSDQVHVLRHSFRPNEPLRQAITEIIQPELRENRSFVFYGSDERIVEINDLGRSSFAARTSKIENMLGERSHFMVNLQEIRPRVLYDAKTAGAVALQLAMKPVESTEYRAFLKTVTEFDTLGLNQGVVLERVGWSGYAPGFDETYAYLTLPYEQLISLDDRESDDGRRVEGLKTKIYALRNMLGARALSSFYQLIPEPRLSGRHVARSSRADAPYDFSEKHAS